MYDQYFGLNESPFDLSTDPRFLYLSPAHARARAYLDYSVFKGDGLVVITGEIGVGKSTLIHDISAREHRNAEVLVIREPHPTVVEFLQALLLECGHDDVPQSKPELLGAVHDELSQRFMWGKRTTLIIDEAQTLNRRVLEELRMLADRQVGADKPLSIVLVGQPGLRDNLAGEDMEQFRQRVRLSFHLAALDEAETWRYIEKRLEVAGACNGPWPIFREDTIGRIHRFSGGIPRLINVLADLSLTAAYLDGVDSVGLQQVDSAIAELGWVPYTQRRRRPTLAMPGLGFAARLRESIAPGVQRLGDVIATGVAHTSRTASGWRQRLPELARAPQAVIGPFLARCLASLRSLPAVLKRRSAPARSTVAATASRWRRQLGAQPWMTANAMRGAAIAFIGITTASVVISGSRDTPNDAVALPLQQAVQAASLQQTKRLPETTGEQLSPQPVQTAKARIDAATASQTPARARQSLLLLDTGPMGDLSRPVAARLARESATAVAADRRESADGVLGDPFVAPTPVQLPGLEGPNWIMAQQPDKYVIQILAARDPTVVERFLQGKARELDLAYYRRMRDDQEWHVVVSGLYPDYPAAKQATAELPEDVRKTGPWVRPLSTVQDDIRSASRQLQARALL